MRSRLLEALALVGLLISGCNAFAPSSRMTPSRLVSHTLNDRSRLQKTEELTKGDESSPQLTYSEASRRFRRTYYGHNDWKKHRSEDRFLKNLFSTYRSGIVRQLAREVGVVVGISATVCLWNALLVNGYEDLQGIHHAALATGMSLPALGLPLEPFTLSSPALGLLLVFRTNASYGRWAEARKAWGSLINHSRNLLRLSASWTSTDVPPQERQRVLDHMGLTVWAFARSHQRQLLGEEEDEAAYQQALLEHDVPPRMFEHLVSARHKPTAALFEVTNAINALPMTYLRKLEVDKSSVALCDAMGACERIFSSPVPLVYTRHTARFLGGWILGLPLSLYGAFESTWNHWALLPATAVIAFFLFGIEELAIQLEEPFSILPLAEFVEGIGLSAKEHAEWHFAPRSDDLELQRQSTTVTNGMPILNTNNNGHEQHHKSHNQLQNHHRHHQELQATPSHQVKPQHHATTAQHTNSTLIGPETAAFLHNDRLAERRADDLKGKTP